MEAGDYLLLPCGGKTDMADTATTKTVDNTTGPAPVDTTAPATSPEVKTVDNTTGQAPEAADTKTEGNVDAKADKAEGKPDEKGTEADKAGDKGTDAEGNEHDGDNDDAEHDDDLDADELEALDAKVRRRVSKVQRENANLRGRLKTTEAERANIERENNRLTVALNAGLGGDLLKFLTGDTVEELEKNAADLLEVVGYNGRVTPSNGPVERANPRRGSIDPASAVANETNLDNIGARIYRR